MHHELRFIPPGFLLVKNLVKCFIFKWIFTTYLFYWGNGVVNFQFSLDIYIFTPPHLETAVSLEKRWIGRV